MTKRQVAQHKPGMTMAIGGPLPRTRATRAQGGLAGLLASVSISAAALALATLPQQARAQNAVNAIPTGVNATVTQSSTLDQVTVTASQATVDWALDANGVSTGVFLNANTTLNFQGSGSYTVLNRVNPMTLTGTLALNGNVTSSPQGKIWFYNPGGWAVGSGGNIDVGSLVLTSNPITVDNDGNPATLNLYGANSAIRFGQAIAGSSVTNDGRIAARNNGSYVALVAPRVVQSGTVTTNGTTAYVAVGAADIRINNGLFDLVVTSGTDDAQGVVHTGTTQRFAPNSSSATPQAIYLASVPKNDAMTMLVSGNIGYNSASSASQSGGKIVLSSGYDMVGGQPVAGAVAPAGSITLTRLSLQTTTQGVAANNITVSAGSGNAVFASDDLSLQAAKRIDVVAFGEGGLFINGSLALDAGSGKTGGIIDVSVDGGAGFQVGGDFDAFADGIGAIRTDAGGALLAGAVGEAATGGSVKIALADAFVSVGGDTSLSASAQGGLGGASAGSARAGTISFSSTSATRFDPDAPLNLQVNADATIPPFGAGPTTGASATGGSIDLAFGGSFVADSISASATGQASAGRDNAPQNAVGGSVSLTFSGSGSTVNVRNINLATSAGAANAGIATGGSVTFKIDGATLNAPVPADDCDGPCPQQDANIFLRNFRDGTGPTAGSIDFTIVNGGTLDLAGQFSSIDLSSSARAVSSGTGTGANISFTVDGGSVNVPRFSIESDGSGGSSGALSNGRGGDITVTLRNSGTINASSGFALDSSGFGGDGDDAGDGTGGAVLVSIADGSLSSSAIDVRSSGFAGNQFGGGMRVGTGFGGSAAIRLTSDSSFLSANGVTVDAPGQAGRSEAAAFALVPVAVGNPGGNGRGGSASVVVNAGFLTAGTLRVDAAGDGGNGSGGGAGGSGTGGTTEFTVNGGSASLFALIVSADGRGGFGASFGEGNPVGNGGAGTGGAASLIENAGSLTTNSILLSATGNAPETISFGEGGSITFDYGGGGSVSGDGPAVGGDGGAGQGGITTLLMTGGNLVNASGAPVNSIKLDSRGVGGNGGDAFSNSSTSQLSRGSGGTGSGGTANFVLGGGNADFNSVELDASGTGGESGQEFGDVSGIPSNGGNGGAGFGGDATITIGTPIAAITGFESTRFYSASTAGVGANGGDGTTGGAGGAGRGGPSHLVVTSPDVFVDQFNLDAFGRGGSGGSSGLANAGGTGGAGAGGVAELQASGGGVSFTANSGSLVVDGQGGVGGSGGSGSANNGDSAGKGGTGGAGTGGAVRLTASDGAMLDLSRTSEFEIVADGSGATGGDGGNAAINGGIAIGDGGTGGAGIGGSLEFTSQGGALRLGDVTASIDGTGGGGGGRHIVRGSSTDASNGGDGGDGFGGHVSFSASGSGGSIQASALDIHVDGTGGSGTDAQGYDPITFVGARGGAGVAGTGGTIQFDSFDQATITIDGTSSLTANGNGAFGGIGADGATNPTSGFGGAGGVGGNSGQGSGGSLTINAEGGLIETGDLTVFLNGIGTAGVQGGQGGTGIVPPGSPEGTPAAADGTPGDFGIGGAGVGGAALITAQADEGGSAAGLDLGSVTLDVRGKFDFGGFIVDDIAGKVEITDRAGDGEFNLASLDIVATGNAVFNPLSVSILSIDAPIRVANNLGASTAGSITVTAIGSGGLEVGGQLGLGSGGGIVLTSSQGGLIHAQNISLDSRGVTLVSAQNCDGPLCQTVRADNQFLSFADGDFGLLGPALIEAGGFLQVSSQGNVTGEAGSGYRARDIFISAQGDATVRNASGGGLEVNSGLVLGEGATFVDGSVTLGEDDRSGIFDLSTYLLGSAGTSIDVLEGTTIDTGNAIRLLSADDIRIGAGASLTSHATNSGSSSAQPSFIRLAAGSLRSDATFPAGNVASLRIASGVTVDATTGPIELSGGAIDARGATFRAADFTADVVDPPVAGAAQRTDNGQLMPPCLEGDICLGTIAATGAVRIGQGDSAPVRFTGTGGITGASVTITSRDTLVYGAAASPFTIASPGAISLTSQARDVALVGNALIDGGTVALSAPTGSIVGNGRLRSAGDIGIDVGADITLDSLVAGRQLTTVAGIGGALEPLYSLPGNLAITSLQTGALTAVRAGGSIVIGTATTGGNDLSLAAGTLVSLGSDSNVANLTLRGRDVAFATVTANGKIVLSATNGIAGASATAGGSLQADSATLSATTLRSGGDMALTTSGAATLGTATSGGDLTIGSGALTFAGLTSTGSTAIDASSIAGGNIAAGTSLAARATDAIELGVATAGTTLALDGATLAADTLTSGGDLALTSSGAARIGDADAGGDLTASVGDLTFDSLTSRGSTQIAASSVDGGSVDAGAALKIRSPGAIALGSASAGDTLDLDGATIDAGTLTSGAAMTLASAGATTLGTAISGGDLSATTGGLTFSRLGSTGRTTIDAASVTGGDIAAGTALAVTASGAIALGTGTAGTSLLLNGATIGATTLRSGGDMALTTSGATTLGTANSGGDLTIDSGALTFAGLTSTGSTAIDASSITGGNIDAGTSLAARATDAIELGVATAGTTLALDGATLAADTLRSGGDLALTSSGAARIGDADAGGDLTASVGDLTFDSLTSRGSTAIDASSVSGGDIGVGAALTIRSPGAIALGTGTAGTSLVLNAATIGATTLRSGGDMALTTSGATTLGTATSGGDLTIDSGALTFAGLTSTGSTTIDGSSITGGNVAAGTSLAARATDAIELGVATAGTTLALDGATLAADTLTSGGDMALTSSGAARIGDADAGGDLTASVGDLTFDSLISGGSTRIAASSVDGGSVDAGAALTVRSPGAIALVSASAGDTLDLDGATIDAGTLTSGAAMTLASAGATTLGTAISGGDLSATTGDLTFSRLGSTGTTTIDAASVTGGDIAAGTALAVTASGAIALGTGTAGTSLALNGATIGATTLRSGGATSLNSTGATTLGSANAGTTFTAKSGAFQFAGITANSDAAISASTIAGGDVTSTTGAIRFVATGIATLGQLRAGTDVSAQATTLTFAGINAGRDVTIDVTTLAGTAIATGRDLTIRSVNDLTFGSIAAGRNLSLDARQGAITISTDIDAGGTVSLTGDAILVKAAGALTIARATADNGDIAITTDGLLQVATAASRGDLTLTSTANSLILGPIIAGRTLAIPSALNPSGTSKGTPGPGAITLNAAQAVTMQGTVDALTSLAATAGTLIDQRSLAVGKTIAYRSADLTLGQSAALGQSTFTSGIALTNTGSAGALLGDVAGSASGYRLDNAEFGRIHSGGDVSLAAGSSLTVGTLSASAASGSGGVADGNIGASSTLALSTSGDLSVGGALALGNAAGNMLRLSSGSLTLDAGAASVRLVEGSGRGGTLAIATGELSALTSTARSAIVGMDGNAINLRLAQNDGVSDGRTLFEAGAISIAASGRVLIQNTAVGQTFDARRGFVADSFAIDTGGTTGSTTGGATSTGGRPLIVINGTVAGTTGLAALRLVKVTGGFDELSTVNGCRLFTATCGSPQFDPIQDVIEDEIGRGANLDGGDAIGEGTLITIDRFDPLGFEAVIDEPVTGSGNDDFLVPEAGAGDQQCEADDKTKCDKPPEG